MRSRGSRRLWPLSKMNTLHGAWMNQTALISLKSSAQVPIWLVESLRFTLICMIGWTIGGRGASKIECQEDHPHPSPSWINVGMLMHVYQCIGWENCAIKLITQPKLQFNLDMVLNTSGKNEENVIPYLPQGFLGPTWVIMEFINPSQFALIKQIGVEVMMCCDCTRTNKFQL